MRGLDLRNFKKTATDGKSSTFKNNKGAEIKISHAGLSPAHLSQLKALPIHKDEGGGVPQPEGEPTPSPTATPAPEPMSTDTGPLAAPPLPMTLQQAQQTAPPGPTIPDDTSTASTAPTLTAPDQNLPGAGELVTGGQGSTFPSKNTNFTEEGVQQELKGIGQQADVQGRLSQAKSSVDERRQQAQEAIAANFDSINRNLESYHQQFLQDYGDGHINPNQYMENMGVGSKVASAIGLLLGGIGSAYTHQGNPAMDFLNKQIDRNIEAQQAGLNNKMNLYHANLAYFKDKTAALNETRAQMMDITATQMQKAADDLGTPMAKAQANIQAGNLKTRAAGERQQAAIRTTIQNQLGQNNGMGLTPMSLEAAGLIPPGEGAKEGAIIDKNRDSILAVQDYFDQMKKLQTTASRLGSPIQSHQQIAALNTGLLNRVLHNSDARRVTEQSLAAEFAPLTAGFLGDAKTQAVKQDQMLGIIGSHSEPTPYTSQIARQYRAPSLLPLFPYQTRNIPKVGNIVTDRNGQKSQIVDQTGRQKPVK